jgi:ssDNA-binding Zn-finger/Zn-ribbon topoisomerase 1
VARRGRFGPFAGCDRYPECDYIHRTGPPPPPPLPFEVECPKCGEGRLTARRARRTGNVFYGCGRYPACDFTTNFEPTGAVHDADAGAVGLKDESGICLRCGASVDLPGDRAELPGKRLAGGEPDPAALAPSRKRRAPARGGSNGASRKRRTTKTAAAAEPGSDDSGG